MAVVKKVLIAIVVIVAVLAVVSLFLPRQVHVERSASIAAPRATVFALLNGYKRFNEWSPWAAMDPNAKYTYSGPDAGVGAKMAWVGDPKSVGSGSQEIVESQPYERVKSALDFGDQGKATALFVLAKQDAGTKVTWGFDTDLGMNPVARYFGLMFDRMIGKDYEKGLAGLAALAESLPKVDFEGLGVAHVEVAPITVAYVEASSSKDEKAIAAAIGGGYAEVQKFMKAQRLEPAGAPLTIDTKWDDTGYAFDAALPVNRAPDDPLPADSKVKVKQTYAGKVLKVVHKGAYREMPGTYDKLFAYAAAHGLERNGPTWDEYVSDPGSTPEPELITNLYVPVK
jgi:effector-binding domain-containing protein